MPHLDGFEVLELLKPYVEKQSYLPIVILTADDSLDIRERALAAGAKDFLNKNILNKGHNRSEALLRVRNLLETRFLYLQIRNQNSILEERIRDRTHDLKEANERLSRQAKRSRAMVHFAARLNAQLDLASVVEAVCEETALAMNMPVSVLRFYDETQDAFVLAGTRGLPAEYETISQPVPRSLLTQFLNEETSGCAVADLDPLRNQLQQKLIDQFHLRSWAWAALKRDGNWIGTLGVMSIEERREFSEDDLSLLIGLSDQAVQAISNAQLFEDAKTRYSNLQALRAIDLAIISTLDKGGTLDVVLDQVIDRLDVDAADILFYDPETDRLTYAAGKGFFTDAREFVDKSIQAGAYLRSFSEGGTVGFADLRDDDPGFIRRPLFAEEEFLSYHAVPLVAKGKTIGALEVFHRKPFHAPSEWLFFLEALAGQASIAIDSADLFVNLEKANAELVRTYDATLEGWVAALDLRDKETEGHTQRVTQMGLVLAAAMNFNEIDLTNFRRGALLHDIGKIGIPDHILHKPGALTPDERAIIELHPIYAHDFLSSIDYLRPAIHIPYCHHEKWDGTGYPQRLAREDIPFSARIFAVIDVWDALTSDRPYRKAWSEEKTLEHIRSLSGSHFDPAVVEAFLALRESSAASV
jgi:response regulator RpfG family c-di-GMP phosphodiesterase